MTNNVKVQDFCGCFACLVGTFSPNCIFNWFTNYFIWDSQTFSKDKIKIQSSVCLERPPSWIGERGDP